jgi:competence protein ComEA
MLSRLLTRREQAILLGLAVAIVLGSGVFWWRGSPSDTAPVLASPSSESDTPDDNDVVVSVAGAVQTPGVYSFHNGDRVTDALERAGGVSAEGDTARINLAARLVDGTTLYVPGGETPEAEPLNPAAYRIQIANETTTDPQPGNGASILTPLNINAATREELQQLPGIGPTYADAILRYREATPFRRKSDLLYVQGIGAKRFEGIRDLITVE